MKVSNDNMDKFEFFRRTKLQPVVSKIQQTLLDYYPKGTKIEIDRKNAKIINPEESVLENEIPDSEFKHFNEYRDEHIFRTAQDLQVILKDYFDKTRLSISANSYEFI